MFAKFYHENIRTKVTTCLHLNLYIPVAPKCVLWQTEDPNEMPHDAVFYQGLHSLLRQKRSSAKEKHFFYLEIISGDSSIYTRGHPYESISTYGVGMNGTLRT